jgi:hypothetical protein
VVAPNHRAMTDTYLKFIARALMGTSEIQDSRFEIRNSPCESHCVDAQDPR